ncbi:hypothetical protein ID866_9361 [Astraeus odoratus]|nr:hypothetical protein ID866_9361 [Astraeus odoratus]
MLFNALKTMSRWTSKLFMHYLQKNAVILTPYLHNRLDLIEKLTHFILPPVW